MDQRLSLITFGVPDLAAVRAFYVDGLGWSPLLDVPGAVCFLQVAPGVVLSLFPAPDLADDVGRPVGAGPGAVTLARNVGTPAEVDEQVRAFLDAGAHLVKPAQPAQWGGYHAYVADPAGALWEIAHNPGWSVAADGTVTMTR